jgi:hypothetical protein
MDTESYLDKWIKNIESRRKIYFDKGREDTNYTQPLHQ